MATATQPKPHIAKVLMIGDSGAGKTSFMRRYINDKFSSTYRSTIGADFLTKDVETPNKRLFKIQIWDTAGRERFVTITRTYYRSASACIIFYDTTKRESFQNVPRWIEELDQHCSTERPLVKMIIGTKTDLAHQRQVSFEEAAELAQHLGALHFEVSAKDGLNITEAGLALTVAVERQLAANPTLEAPATVPVITPPEPRSTGWFRCTIL